MKSSHPDSFPAELGMEGCQPVGILRDVWAPASVLGTRYCQWCSTAQAHVEGLGARHRLSLCVAAWLSWAAGKSYKCLACCLAC